MMISSFCGGKSFIWDETCSDTFFGENLVKSMTDPGIIVRQAEDFKLAWYQSLSYIFLFVPIADQISLALTQSPYSARLVLRPLVIGMNLVRLNMATNKITRKQSQK